MTHRKILIGSEPVNDWLLLLLGPSTPPGPDSSLIPKVNRQRRCAPLVFRAAHTKSKPQLSLNLVLLPPQPVVFLENPPLGVPELIGTSLGQEVKENPGPPNLAPAVSQTVLWPFLAANVLSRPPLSVH